MVNIWNVIKKSFEIDTVTRRRDINLCQTTSITVASCLGNSFKNQSKIRSYYLWDVIKFTIITPTPFILSADLSLNTRTHKKVNILNIIQNRFFPFNFPSFKIQTIQPKYARSFFYNNNSINNKYSTNNRQIKQYAFKID